MSDLLDLAQLERNIISQSDDKLKQLLREADIIMHERDAIGETLENSDKALEDLMNIELEFELIKM